jgi:hypothetical protein
MWYTLMFAEIIICMTNFFCKDIINIRDNNWWVAITFSRQTLLYTGETYGF